MTWFSGTEHEIIDIQANIEDVRAYFCDPAVFRAALPSVETAVEIEKNVWEWTLKTKKEKGITFKGNYTVEYLPNEVGMTWHTREGNMDSSGTLVLSEKDGKTVIDYHETVKIDLPVPRLLTPVLKKIVGREIESDIKSFLRSGVRDIEKSSSC